MSHCGFRRIGGRRHARGWVLRYRDGLARMVVAGLFLVWAQAALAQKGQPLGPGLGQLGSMLDDKSHAVRLKAAEGLGRVGGRQAVGMLRKGLHDKELEVRIAAAAALGRIGGWTAVTVLAEALKDPEPQVRVRAVEALCEAGTVNSIPILARVFDDEAESVRLRAALMLGQIGHHRAVPALAEASLDDPSPAVRAAATRHLGIVGARDQRAVQALRRVLSDREPAVRMRAVEALGNVQTAQAVPALQTALQDADPAVRSRATATLGHVLARTLE